MLTLRRIVAQVEEESCFDATLTRSSSCGVLEEPRTTDDLVTLMQGLMGIDSDQDRSLARTPSPPSRDGRNNLRRGAHGWVHGMVRVSRELVVFVRFSRSD